MKSASFPLLTISAQVLLSASEINEEIVGGRILIQPFDPQLLRRCSYTLRLARRWLRWKRSETPIRIWSHDATKAHLEPVIETPLIILCPGDFVLASTIERISLPHDIGGIVCTLSHVSRFGLTATAGSLLIRPGYGFGRPRTLTLELASLNPSPLEIQSGLPVCHLAFFRSNRLPANNSNSIYEERDAPSPPMLYEDMAKVLATLAGPDTS